MPPGSSSSRRRDCVVADPIRVAGRAWPSRLAAVARRRARVRTTLAGALVIAGIVLFCGADSPGWWGPLSATTGLVCWGLAWVIERR